MRSGWAPRTRPRGRQGTCSTRSPPLGERSLLANFDLAAAFGDGLFPEATGANYLVEILPTLF